MTGPHEAKAWKAIWSAGQGIARLTTLRRWKRSPNGLMPNTGRCARGFAWQNSELFGQLRPVAFGNLVGDPFGVNRRIRRAHLFDRRRTARARRFEAGAADGRS